MKSLLGECKGARFVACRLFLSHGKEMMRLLGWGLVAFFVAVVTGWGWVWLYLGTPVSEENPARVVPLSVKSGDTLRPVLERIEVEGALPHSAVLYGYARLTGGARLHVGEYAVHTNQTPGEILTMLREGRVVLAKFTLAEGLNRWQVRDQLATEGWVGKTSFDQLCDDPAFLKQHKIPGPTCEGYLYPETYTMAQGAQPKAIFAAMFAMYRKHYTEATADGRGWMELSERELVTLASIVEKETAVADERARIACVFYNRLQSDPPWRLDTDPTVIYAATLKDPNFDGNIKRSHLRRMPHPYNTYHVTGLPPGPIANPGRAALDAVVRPQSCSDFFFVSMNNGRHVFCPDLRCHQRAVQKWQVRYFSKRRQQERANGAP